MREKRGMTQDISTHTLTWSVTSVYKSLWSAWIISTHTLTWSVTSGAPRRSRSGRFQLTRSRGAWREVDPHLKDKRDFNSHAHVERDIADEYGYEKYSRFQLTRSRGAWRFSEKLKRTLSNFNSHAHVERDFSAIRLLTVLVLFQLTRSRGAWPQQIWKSVQTFSFQLTRSRGAWPVGSSSVGSSSVISTHTLTWSVTP